MGDRDGAAGIMWKLEAVYRTGRGESLPPRPEYEGDADDWKNEPESDDTREVREFIEALEAERGIVPGSNQSLMERMAMALPWDDPVRLAELTEGLE
jgi:hypothetical protein